MFHQLKSGLDQGKPLSGFAGYAAASPEEPIRDISSNEKSQPQERKDGLLGETGIRLAWPCRRAIDENERGPTEATVGPEVPYSKE